MFLNCGFFSLFDKSSIVLFTFFPAQAESSSPQAPMSLCSCGKGGAQIVWAGGQQGQEERGAGVQTWHMSALCMTQSCTFTTNAHWGFTADEDRSVQSDRGTTGCPRDCCHLWPSWKSFSAGSRQSASMDGKKLVSDSECEKEQARKPSQIQKSWELETYRWGVGAFFLLVLALSL